MFKPIDLRLGRSMSKLVAMLVGDLQGTSIPKLTNNYERVVRNGEKSYLVWRDHLYLKLRGRSSLCRAIGRIL